MNNIKELRKTKRMSQSEFADFFGIPLRTVQKWEQQVNDPLPYLMSLIQEEIILEQYIDVTKYMIKPKNEFKRVIKGNFKNINHIHPLQQHRVEEIIKALEEITEVNKIVVFGSSTTYKCNYESDIDLYVELDKDINAKKYDVDCPVDYWTNFTVSKEMLAEINKKGVVVYDRSNLLR